MVHLPRRWDIPVRYEANEVAFDACQCLFSHAHRWCGIPAVRHLKQTGWSAAACQHAPSILQQLCSWAPSQLAYILHTFPMHSVHGCIRVQDDKLKHSCWQVAWPTFVVMLYQFVVNSGTWNMILLSHEDANRKLIQTLLDYLPSSLCKFLKVDSRAWLLPRMYVTVKSKCYSGPPAVRRSCSRGGHSCCRKVVSFAAWPGKLCWRMVSRGLETIAKHFGDGFEAWRLRDAPEMLRKRPSVLQTAEIPSLATCFRCSSAKPPWSGVVADAGQFFEQTRIDQVESAMETLLSRARAASGHSTVTVFRSSKRRAFMGGAEHLRGAARTFTFDELACAMSAFARMTLCSVGVHTASMSGLPIGGFLSKIACSLVLCEAEGSCLWLPASCPQVFHGMMWWLHCAMWTMWSCAPAICADSACSTPCG